MKLKKFTALATAACMIFSMATSVFAEDEVGTQDNPEVLTELTGDTISIEGGTSEEGYWGYFYKYTVPNDAEGTIKCSFEITSSSEEAYNFNVDNLTSGAYASIAPQYNDGVTTASVNAMAGDEIQIKIMGDATWNDDWSVATYSDLTITWVAEAKQVGIVESPDPIVDLFESVESTVIPGTDGYYYSYKCKNEGTLALYIDEFSTIDQYSKYPDFYDDDPMLVNSLDELKAEIIFTNVTQNKTVKYSEGTELYTKQSMWGSESYNVIQLPYNNGDEIVIAVSTNAVGYDDGVKITLGFINKAIGTEDNPHVISSNNVSIKVEPYMQYFLNIKGNYAQFPLTITGGELQFVDADTYYEYESFEKMELIDEDENGYSVFAYNPTEETLTYTLSFDIPLGNELNKDTLETGKTAEHTFKVDETDWYYYTWTATEDGIVKFNVSSDNAWAYGVDNTTTGYAGSFIHSYDEKVVHEAIDVTKGDELVIVVMATDKDGAVTKDTKVTTSLEFVSTEGGIVDTEVVDKIVDDITNEEYEAGSTVTIEMDEATVVPAEVLKAIIEYNKLLAADEEKPLALEIVMDAGTWTITNVTSATPIDLSVVFDTKNTATTVIDKVANGNAYKTFTIAHNGDFGFDAKFTFTYDKDFAGKKATLYWDNNGNLVSIGSCTVDAKGNVAFDMDHASDYVVVVEGTADVEPDSTPTPDNTGNGGVGDGGQQVKPGDSANIVMLFALAAIAGAVVLTKKKTVME